MLICRINPSHLPVLHLIVASTHHTLLFFTSLSHQPIAPSFSSPRCRINPSHLRVLHLIVASSHHTLMLIASLLHQPITPSCSSPHCRINPSHPPLHTSLLYQPAHPPLLTSLPKSALCRRTSFQKPHASSEAAKNKCVPLSWPPHSGWPTTAIAIWPPSAALSATHRGREATIRLPSHSTVSHRRTSSPTSGDKGVLVDEQPYSHRRTSFPTSEDKGVLVDEQPTATGGRISPPLETKEC